MSSDDIVSASAAHQAQAGLLMLLCVRLLYRLRSDCVAGVGLKEEGAEWNARAAQLQWLPEWRGLLVAWANVVS